MLSINDLSIKLRHPILDNFSYQFHLGKIYLIIATNGTGKTTFFRTLTNLIKRSSGGILFDHEKFSNRKQSIFFYESPNWLDSNLSGLDYLKFIKSQWKSQLNIKEIVDYWGMSEYIKIPIKKYSLGMKQKVVISMYFISDGLDEKSRQLLYQQIYSFAKSKKKCVILSSHYRSDMEPLVDHILELKDQVMKEVSK